MITSCPDSVTVTGFAGPDSVFARALSAQEHVENHIGLEHPFVVVFQVLMMCPSPQVGGYPTPSPLCHPFPEVRARNPGHR